MTISKQALLKSIVTHMLDYDYTYTNKDSIEFYSKTEKVEGEPEVIITLGLPGLKTELRRFLKANIRLN